MLNFNYQFWIRHIFDPMVRGRDINPFFSFIYHFIAAIFQAGKCISLWEIWKQGYLDWLLTYTKSFYYGWEKIVKVATVKCMRAELVYRYNCNSGISNVVWIISFEIRSKTWATIFVFEDHQLKTNILQNVLVTSRECGKGFINSIGIKHLI